MVYNPFKKLDELRYPSGLPSQTTKPYDPWSGYSSLQSSVKNTTTKPPAPPYTPPPATDTAKATTQPSYLTNSQTLADKQKQQAQERLNRSKANTITSYDEKGRLLKESIPMLQNQFAKTQQYFDTGNTNALNKANIAKENIEVEAGSAQRQNAETLRTGQRNIANRFAGLNTSDSYGAGSHVQAQENVQSDFNRLTAENLRQKTNQKAAIDQQLVDYQTSAEKELNGVKAKLDTVIMQIQSDITMNDLQKQNAIDSTIADYEDAVNGIDTSMNKILQDYQLKLMELEKTSLSPEFMQTGKPQNESDYKFLVENSEKYDKYGAMLGKTGGSGDQSQNSKTKALKIAQKIKDSSNYAKSGITGLMRMAMPGSSRRVEGLLQQLTTELQLEDVKRLRGQGTITDAEREILANSISALDLDQKHPGRSKLTLEDFNNEIQNMIDKLSAETEKSTTNRDVYDQLLSRWGY